VRKYEEASRIGASDSEVYEGLAEAWVRQIEMAMQRGQSPEEAYRRAKEASERASEAERERVGGKLKRGYAALMTMATLGSGQSTAERVKECMTATEGVLEAEPDNPYARDVAAGCYAFSADAAQARGEDPEPLYRKAIGLLEPAVKKHPHFHGHYGTAWQNQQKEFAEFPGAILMTTNCLQKPQAAYSDNIFTTGLATYHRKHKSELAERNVAFFFEFGDLTVGHLGDIGEVPSQAEIEELNIGEVDILLVPVGGGDTLDPTRAVEIVGMFEPKLVIPMHYRQGGLADHIAERLEPVEMLKLSKSSLPEETQVVILTASS